MRLAAEASRRHQKEQRLPGDITGDEALPELQAGRHRRGSVNVAISMGATRRRRRSESPTFVSFYREIAP